MLRTLSKKEKKAILKRLLRLEKKKSKKWMLAGWEEISFLCCNIYKY
jgi:hypothetical protein